MLDFGSKISRLLILNVISLWLIITNLSPETWWQNISLCSLFLTFGTRISASTQLILTTATTLTILSLYYNWIQENKWALLLWMTLFIYITLIGSLPMAISSSKLHMRHCSIICLTIGSALFCAWVVDRVEYLLYAVLFFGGCQATYALGDFLFHFRPFYSHDVFRATGTEGSPLLLYCTLLVCLGIEVSLVYLAPNTQQRIFWIFIGGITATALTVTLSRTGLFAEIIALVWFAFYIVKKKVLIVAPLVILVLLTAISFFLRAHQNAASLMNDLQYRSMLWHRGVAIFMEHPLSGVGLDQINFTVLEYHKGVQSFVNFATPDNQLLQFLDEMGFSGGILLIVLCAATMRLISGRRDTVSLALGSSFAALLVACFFDAPFGRYSRLTDTFLISLLFGCLLKISIADTIKLVE